VVVDSALPAGPVGEKDNLLHRKQVLEFLQKPSYRLHRFLAIVQAWEPLSFKYRDIVPEHLVTTGKFTRPSPYIDPETDPLPPHTRTHPGEAALRLEENPTRRFIG